jgi:hypothetical protein
MTPQEALIERQFCDKCYGASYAGAVAAFGKFPEFLDDQKPDDPDLYFWREKDVKKLLKQIQDVKEILKQIQELEDGK